MANIMYQSLAMQEVRLGRREAPWWPAPHPAPAQLACAARQTALHVTAPTCQVQSRRVRPTWCRRTGASHPCLALNRPLSPGLRRRLPPSTTPQGLFACAGVGPGDPAAFSAASAGLNCADDRLPYSTAELNAPEYSTDDFRMFNFKVRTDHQLRAPERAR